MDMIVAGKANKVIASELDISIRTVRAMQGGAVTLLEKPCEEDELWNAIRKALGQDAEDRSKHGRRQELRKMQADSVAELVGQRGFCVGRHYDNGQLDVECPQFLLKLQAVVQVRTVSLKFPRKSSGMAESDAKFSK